MNIGDTVTINNIPTYQEFDAVGISYFFEQISKHFLDKNGVVDKVDDQAVCIEFKNEKYDYCWFPISSIRSANTN